MHLSRDARAESSDTHRAKATGNMNGLGKGREGSPAHDLCNRYCLALRESSLSGNLSLSADGVYLCKPVHDANYPIYTHNIIEVAIHGLRVLHAQGGRHAASCVLFLLSFTAVVPFINGRFIRSASPSPRGL